MVAGECQQRAMMLYESTGALDAFETSDLDLWSLTFRTQNQSQSASSHHNLPNSVTWTYNRCRLGVQKDSFMDTLPLYSRSTPWAWIKKWNRKISA